MKRDPVLLLFIYTYIEDINTTCIFVIDTYRTVGYLYIRVFKSNKKEHS